MNSRMQDVASRDVWDMQTLQRGECSSRAGGSTLFSGPNLGKRSFLTQRYFMTASDVPPVGPVRVRGRGQGRENRPVSDFPGGRGRRIRIDGGEAHHPPAEGSPGSLKVLLLLPCE
jgi:hypothetical protein